MSMGNVTKYLFFPVFRHAGKRYCVRCRLSSRFRFHRVTDRFPRGDVHRVWAGPILLVVMVDSEDFTP